MRVLVLEAWRRPERIAALRKTAARASAGAGMAYDSKGTDDGSRMDHFVRLAKKAKRARAIAQAHTPDRVDPHRRRSRLAGLLRVARKGMAHARQRPGERGLYGRTGAYGKAARALTAYQKKRYQYSYGTQSRRKPKWHVQPGDKPKPYLQQPPHVASHPVYGLVHHMKRRLSKEYDDLRKKVSPELQKALPMSKKDYVHGRVRRAGFDPHIPKFKDKSKLPKYATTEPTKRRIKNPVIRRPSVYQNLGAFGPHPANVMVKRDIGRREKKATSRSVRRGEV